ncbi:biotin transporter BioY [Treponema sp.]|uniref:biotin transporter BioY n=1 Tax=Treponema sp. TaxID=166 RepID=UPI00298E2C21|nr:biotin transporter BioY [Treponema sp.]MCQ2240215.1 biotin transporter BioY [Treponema sp.]
MNSKFKGLVLSALFAALISAGSFLIIPLPGGIPIVLQDMMSMLSGLILGPVYGAIAVAVFLLLGSMGLPVFSGKAGFHILTSHPTCGFLYGYFLAALVSGLFLHILLNKNKEHSNLKQYILISIAALIATIICFTMGIIGFTHITHKTVAESIPLVVLPFIPGNTIKLILMVPLTKKFRKTVQL